MQVIARATSNRAAIIAALWSCFALQPAAGVEVGAEILKGIHPYVSAGMTWDTNLFRVADSTELVGTSEMSDRYATLEAGVKTGLAVSRQNFLINGRIYNYNYEHSNLDHSGGDAQALWEWTRGDLLSGNLGYEYERKLRSFTYRTTSQKELRAENKVFGKADRWLTDRWRLGVLGNWSNIGFDVTKTLDRDRQQVGFGIDYVTPIGNSVGFQTTIANADYYKAHYNDYKEYAAGPAVDWQVTGKTKLHAEASYTSRKYADNSVAGQQDVTGFVGRLAAVWKVDDERKIKLAVYRNINNIGDEVDTYAVIHGASIEPVWQLTGKLSLRGLLDSQRHDFKGSSVPQREDKLNSAGAWLDWKLYRNVGLALGYNTEKRTSNYSAQEYKFQVMQAQLVAGF